MKKSLIRHIIAFVAVLITMFVAIILVYCIPNSIISNNVEQSLKILDGLGQNSKYTGSHYDYSTDTTMVYTMLKGNGNPIYEAMYNLNYARYWHGYSVFLRPLFMVFDVGEVWFIISCIFFILLTTAILLLWKKLNIGVAVVFFVSILCFYVSTISTSLQYSGVFNITLIFVICIIVLKDKASFDTISLTFMIVGMVTNFIDFLTVPLITLGIPLIIYILLCDKNEKTSFLKILKIVVILSLVWLLGYSLTWVAKWCLGTLFTGDNVFKLALQGITERGGVESGVNVLDRLRAIYANLATLFKNKIVFIGVGFASILLIVFAFVFRVAKTKWKSIGIFLVIGAMPYIWYFVLSNHSFVHNWFTYRTQFITLFSGLYILMSIVDWDKCRAWLKKLKKSQEKIND